MPESVDINVHHITRVEGHGNIVVKANDGTIKKVEWQVPEAPRFFEAMVRGRSFMDIQTIASRICGICSVTHSLAAIKAIESAMGIQVSEQTDRVRRLLQHSEQLESHSLHVGYLVAPDLLGVPSVVPLVSSHPDVVKTVIRIHRLGNEWMELIGGRMTHPVSIRPGGFGMLPTEDDLRGLRERLEGIVPDLKTLAEVVASLAGELPDFERETEYIALVNPPEYALYHGEIGSTDTNRTVPVDQFESVVNEYVSPQSTSKWTRWHRDSFAVGALARFNLNAEYLTPLAAETAKTLGLQKGCCNPYMNSVAQVVEAVQAVEDGIQLCDELLEAGIEPEKPQVEPRAGEGAGCVEAPRGILFHRYAFDENGLCTSANICIPTGQNHGNIQHDFEALVPQVLPSGQEETERLLKMLVRAYDPCISCSTHYLDVRFE